MNTIFLQVAEKNVKTTVSLWELLTAGGWIMIPLAILFFVAIYIFFERFFKIRAAGKDKGGFMQNVRNHIVSGDIKAAKTECQETNSPIARMIEKGISRLGNPLKDIEVSIENSGKIEVASLERNLSLLAIIAGAAPMIGFLGTVLGMIQAFIAMAMEEGNVSRQLMSQGIYEAMVTTATGLIIGIFAYITYNFLSSELNKLITRMEHISIEFMDLLQEPQK
jgi:biopolymer transport protein ExbB